MSFFRVQHLSAGYGKNHIIRDITFSMEENSIIGILGSNGSGKTTLIKAICGILSHKGTCYLEDRELESLSPRQIAKQVSYIPQRSGISIDISVLDVVLMGFNPHLKLLEHPTKAMVAAARDALSQVGIAEKENANYLHLSEGQKQLCIFARTIVSGSKLLLMDEPESALDFRHRFRMLDTIRNWTSKTNGGSIVTLHDPVLALNYCDKLILLENGELLDILSPKEDSIERMEQGLCKIYGPISLHLCKTHSGKEILSLLREDIS